MVRKGTHPSPAVRQDHLEAVPQHTRCVGVQGHPKKYSRFVSGSRGSTWQSGQESEPGAEHLEKFESLYNGEAMGLHDSGFLLGKGKGKSLEKGSPGKSKPEEQAQTRKQASKAEAMLQGELDQTLEKVKSKLSRKKQTTGI